MGGWVSGQHKVCVPKMGLSLLALYSKFHFSPEESVFGFGWGGGLARVGGSARSRTSLFMPVPVPCLEVTARSVLWVVACNSMAQLHVLSLSSVLSASAGTAGRSHRYANWIARQRPGPVSRACSQWHSLSGAGLRADQGRRMATCRNARGCLTVALPAGAGAGEGLAARVPHPVSYPESERERAARKPSHEAVDATKW